jgi:8-oxo-dGTP pyrophosphatase MutT (NUDIX family)
MEKQEKDFTLVFCLRRTDETIFDAKNLNYEQNSEVLLGMKKRGFGTGIVNGFGGKIEQGETNENAATRELEEESSIVSNKLNRVGFIKCFMQDMNMNISIYTCYDFSGEAKESDEMKPFWVQTDKINYESMWEDDKLWLPLLLKGKKFIGRYEFDDDDATIIDSETTEQ